MMVGGTGSGWTQDERSKSMNSSAFSCGDKSPVVTQPPGNGVPGRDVSWVPLELADTTWRSVNTVRPHWLAGIVAASSAGVFRVMYSTPGFMLESFGLWSV